MFQMNCQRLDRELRVRQIICADNLSVDHVLVVQNCDEVIDLENLGHIWSTWVRDRIECIQVGAH